MRFNFGGGSKANLPSLKLNSYFNKIKAGSGDETKDLKSLFSEYLESNTFFEEKSTSEKDFNRLFGYDSQSGKFYLNLKIPYQNLGVIGKKNKRFAIKNPFENEQRKLFPMEDEELALSHTSSKSRSRSNSIRSQSRKSSSKISRKLSIDSIQHPQ